MGRSVVKSMDQLTRQSPHEVSSSVLWPMGGSKKLVLGRRDVRARSPSEEILQRPMVSLG
jgi:hypothetical protein